MADFSRDTFDQQKRYVSVRLQQGVPIVDADWNEQDDVRRAERQAARKWYVGDGVPKNNDGFRITHHPDDNCFSIQHGRCLVDGWDAVNNHTLAYTEQALFLDADLASRWNVDPLLALTTPSQDRTDTIYLDVWERRVDSGEDEALINPHIGIETSVRIKREWVVRVAEGVPVAPALAGHAHYVLAVLHRRAGVAQITPEQIEDRRYNGLSAVSHYDVKQFIADAFGPGYTLDQDGQPNLKVSLRETINALLRGTLPGTPIEDLTNQNSNNHPKMLEDRNGDIWVFWHSLRGNYDIYYRRYDKASESWMDEEQLTTSTGSDYYPCALEDHRGDIWVFWRSYRTGTSEIWYNRYDRAAQDWVGPMQLTINTTLDYYPYALEDSNGDVWVFWRANRNSSYSIYCNRYIRASNTWSGDQLLSSTSGSDYEPFAMEDHLGDVWVFWRSNRNSSYYNVWCNRYIRADDTWTGITQLTFEAASSYEPMALEDDDGDLWLFFYSYRNSDYDIWYRRYDRPSETWSSDIQLTTDEEPDKYPYPIKDRNGDLWVFWRSDRGGTYDIWYKRYTQGIGWGEPAQLSFGGGHDYYPGAVEDRDGDLWVVWSNSLASTQIRYRKLITNL